MFQNKYSQQAQQLQQFLDERVQVLSRLSGFVQRRRKLSGRVFVQALVLSWLERPTASLNEVRQSCAEMGVSISESGLQQRMSDKAVTLLRSLFQEGLAHLPKTRQVPAEVLRPFTAVYLLDSTTVSLPAKLKGLFTGVGGSASSAAVKIRLSFDYLRSSIEACEVVAGCAADQNCQQHVNLAQAGSLHLFDLGFFKQPVFEALAAAGAYFVSRLHPQTALYGSHVNDPVCELDTLLPTTTNTVVDLDVTMGRLSRLPVRLIAQKLPEAVAAERRRKAKRQANKHGKTCSARHLHRLGWSLFITNIPRDWLAAQQVLLVYRVRWQIELVFKLWKSQAQLDAVGQCGPNRFLCQLYARLLGVLVFQWMLVDVPFDPTTEPSLPKAFAIVQRYAARLRLALASQPCQLTPLLQLLTTDVLCFALKQKRKTSPSTLARLLAAKA
jgi:DDE family transposase